MKQFTATWNRINLRWMRRQLLPLAGCPAAYLEVGVYEGLTFYNLLDSVFTHKDSWVLGIDAWATPLLMGTEIAADVYERARANMAGYPEEKVKLVRGVSSYVLGTLCASLVQFDGNEAHTIALEWTAGRPAQFDAAFIDSTHTILDVQIDTSLCWRLMQPGGIVVWDCYRGSIKRAVQSFLNLHPHEVLGYTRRQLAARKIADNGTS